MSTHVDPYSLPPILDDAKVAEHFRGMFKAADEKRKTQRRRQIVGLFLFLAVMTVAGFVVRYYR